MLLLFLLAPGCRVSDDGEASPLVLEALPASDAIEAPPTADITGKAGESSSGTDEEAGSGLPYFARGLPQKWEPDRGTPVADAIQVWLLGEEYFRSSYGDHDDPLAFGCTSSFDETEFDGIDLKTRSFLSVPMLKPAVRFSCCISPTPYENALEKALRSDAWELKLQALVLLMMVKSSRHVSLQWKVLKELQEATPSLRVDEFLSELEKRFEPGMLVRELEALVKQGDEIGRYSQSEGKCWAIRAVAAAQHRAAIPQLAKLSVLDNIDISLAAERSLEEFEGEEADRALGECLLEWKYNAAERAGYALLKRDRALLNRLLMSGKATERYLYMQGILLAECDNPASVPILCETVPRYQIIDGKMFAHIARLAGPEHRSMIELLPSRVRPNQLYKALAVEKLYRKRMENLESR